MVKSKTIPFPYEISAPGTYKFLTWEDFKEIDCSRGAKFRAKWRIAQAFVQVIEDGLEFDKITVKEITEACGVSRQTFYNHFVDKFALVDWINSRINAFTVDRIGIDITWETAISKRLEIFSSRAKYFGQIFKAEEYYQYTATEAELVHEYYERNIQRITGRQLTEMESYLLKLYAEGSVKTTTSWLENNDDKSVSFLVDVLLHSLPDFAKRVFLGTGSDSVNKRTDGTSEQIREQIRA